MGSDKKAAKAVRRAEKAAARNPTTKGSRVEDDGSEEVYSSGVESALGSAVDSDEGEDIELVGGSGLSFLENGLADSDSDDDEDDEDDELDNSNEEESNDDEDESSDEDEESGPLEGLSKYVAMYHRTRPPLAALKAKLDKHVIEYEDMEKDRIARGRQKYSQPDEDGFITVLPRSRRGTSDGKGTIVGAATASAETIQARQEAKQAKKSKNAPGFYYKFQRKTAQRSEIAELRRQFDEDRRRIAEMKASRAFVPY